MDKERVKRMRRSTTELEKCVELLGKDYVPAMGCNGLMQVAGHLKNILAENKTLREFAQQVIKEQCWGIAMDGLDIQDLAEKLELIEPHIATKDDVDEESDFETGDTIYKFSKALKGA